MNLVLFRHLWGVVDKWETAFLRFQQAGYAGIEAGVPEPAEADRFRKLLELNHFQYIPQIYSRGATVDEHLDSFAEQLATAKTFQPLFVNSHSGQDAFSEDEAARFFDGALKLEAKSGLAVAHETHRGRILYNPWVTSRMLARFANLKLCCDFSHWVCVCERIIEDQLDIIQQCAERCLHLHARVGYEQGPQVPDPRAPEYQRHLQAHESWWSRIWDAQEKRGDKVTTLTPEFGPPGYLHTLPFTNAPVSNLEEICDWQARRQAANFASRLKSSPGGI